MLNLASERNMKIKEITEAQMAGQYKVIKTGPEGTVLQSPDMHTTLTLDPQAAHGIVQNPDNPNELTLSQQTAMGNTNQPGQQQNAIKQGATVEVPANENMGGQHYDMTAEVTNPAYAAWENGEGDENNPPPEVIKVGINYSISGEERPATWGYHGGEPAEHPEIDDASVFDLETGEDITNQVDSSEIEEAIWADAESSQDDDFVEPDDNYDDRYYDEDVGGDPTDDFIDDVRDKEFEKHNKSSELDHIKRLSGL